MCGSTMFFRILNNKKKLNCQSVGKENIINKGKFYRFFKWNIVVNAIKMIKVAFSYDLLLLRME
jgi:hypothetical protein